MKDIISTLLKRADRRESNVDLVHLNRLVRRYAIEQQQVPRDLAELVELKYLVAVPVAPKGRRFVIDRRRAEVRLE